MRANHLALPAFIAAFLLTGCGMGAIYTHTVRPLTPDMHGTPVGSVESTGNIKHLSISVVSLAWDSNAIGDLAKKKGLSEVYFADIETLSILGFWSQYTVHVYGR